MDILDESLVGMLASYKVSNMVFWIRLVTKDTSQCGKWEVSIGKIIAAIGASAQHGRLPTAGLYFGPTSTTGMSRGSSESRMDVYDVKGQNIQNSSNP